MPGMAAELFYLDSMLTDAWEIQQLTVTLVEEYMHVYISKQLENFWT